MKILKLLAITLILASTTQAQISPPIKPTPENSTPVASPDTPPAPPTAPSNNSTPTPPPVPPIAPIAPIAPVSPKASSNNNDTTHFRIGRLKFTVVDDSIKKNKGEVVDISDVDDDKDKDTSAIRHRKERKIAKRMRHLPHWSGVEMGVNGFTTSSGSLKLPKGYDFLDLRYAVSYTVNLNFWEKSFNLYDNHIHLFTGMGIEWDNFKFSKQMSLIPGIDSIKAIKNTNEYDVNKLTLVYLNMPLMLEFNTSHDKNHTFHLAGGVIVGYMMDSYTKEVFKQKNVEHKAYQEDDFGIDPFRFSAAIRAGYGKFNLFATYGLNKMFSNGPDIHPFTVGLTLIGL